MANKNSKSKSNVAKSAKKSSFKFRWWMAAVIVLIVAIVGIVVLRFSHASGVSDVCDEAAARNVGLNSCTWTFPGGRTVILRYPYGKNWVWEFQGGNTWTCFFYGVGTGPYYDETKNIMTSNGIYCKPSSTRSF